MLPDFRPVDSAASNCCCFCISTPFETPISILALQFGPSVTVLSPTMTSADFCLCFLLCCQFSTRCAGQGQTSPGKPCCLPSNAAEYTSALSVQVSGFTVLGQLTQSGSLLSGSCSSVQKYLYTFLPTPPRDDAVGFKLRFPLQGP